MKPRNKFYTAVIASNVRLTAITPKAIKWALGKVIDHFAFCTSGHKCTCGDCGHKFDIKGKGKYTRCPHCGRKLEIRHTLKRKMTDSSYFSTMEAVDGMLVQRVFLIKATYRKGREITVWCMEVCRLWLDDKGRIAVTSRIRTWGYYTDSFNWMSDIELRKMNDAHWIISDTFVYPHYSTMPCLRRNGMRGRLPDCHPMRLAEKLLSDSRIETMMKAKDHKAVGYFINHMTDLDECWQSYKTARRYHYDPEDYGIWCDMIRLLEKCGRDIHSTKYICPKDLKAEHDKWLKKADKLEKRRRLMEQLAKAKRQEADFYKEKSRFFGIVISDSDIEISVLDSIEAYRVEGEKMKHCVFKCEYYAKTDSVILSAHDKQGNRIETVEFSLSRGMVVQSRGVCNTNTEYHDRIVKLVNDNAHRFLKAKETA